MESELLTKSASELKRGYKNNVTEIRKKIADELKKNKKAASYLRSAEIEKTKANEAFDKKASKKNRSRALTANQNFEVLRGEYTESCKKLDYLLLNIEKAYNGLIAIYREENNKKSEIKVTVEYEDYAERVRNAIDNYGDGFADFADYNDFEEKAEEDLQENQNLQQSKEPEEQGEQEEQEEQEEKREAPRRVENNESRYAFNNANPNYTYGYPPHYAMGVPSDLFKSNFNSVNVAPVTIDVSSIVKKAVESTVEKMSRELDRKINAYLDEIRFPEIPEFNFNQVSASQIPPAVQQSVLQQPVVKIASISEEDKLKISEAEKKNSELVAEILAKEQDINEKLKDMMKSISNVSEALNDMATVYLEVGNKYGEIGDGQKKINEMQRTIVREQQGLQVKQRLIGEDQTGLVNGQNTLFERQKAMVEIHKKALETQIEIENSMNSLIQAQKEIADSQKKIVQNNTKNAEMQSKIAFKQSEVDKLQKKTLQSVDNILKEEQN